MRWKKRAGKFSPKKTMSGFTRPPWRAFMARQPSSPAKMAARTSSVDTSSPVSMPMQIAAQACVCVVRVCVRAARLFFRRTRLAGYSKARKAVMKKGKRRVGRRAGGFFVSGVREDNPCMRPCHKGAVKKRASEPLKRCITMCGVKVPVSSDNHLRGQACDMLQAVDILREHPPQQPLGMQQAEEVVRWRGAESPGEQLFAQHVEWCWVLPEVVDVKYALW